MKYLCGYKVCTLLYVRTSKWRQLQHTPIMYNYILVPFNSEYFEYTLPEYIIKKHPELGEKVLRLQRNEKDTDLVS